MNLTADLYLDMIRSGAASLAQNRQAINDLNVFPIPDGDTGDNMYMTMEAGCNASGNNLAQMSDAVSQGMLLGARGNSGVILSRIFAGMAQGFSQLKEADAQAFGAAMRSGVEAAYHAVSQPVEGTILTVLREGAAAADRSASLEEYFDLMIAGMDLALEHTPDQLDVLKKAGVVDSGGAGLIAVWEGMRAALHGNSLLLEESTPAQTAHTIDFQAFTEDSELEFGYCTEFLLRLQRSKVDLEHFDEHVISDWLSTRGDSMVFFRDGSIVKVHIHTKDPGVVLSKCREWGEFLTIKVENMTLQHHETHMDERFKRSHKALGIIAVAAGDGLSDAFRQMGTDVVIEGGQTMNPPVERFIEAFDEVQADVILVFPNNGNILLTARQAAQLYKKSRVEVIPTKTLGEGYYALANMPSTDNSIEQIVETLSQAIGNVTTGMVSRAIRDTEMGPKGTYLGFCGKDILCGSPVREQAVTELSGKLDAASRDILLLLSGADVPMPEAESLRSTLEASCPLTEVILLPGGQPVYDYILVSF